MHRDQYHRLKFGRFKGVAISEVPVDYLHWLSSQSDLNGWLRGVIEESLDRREREQQQRQEEEIDKHVKEQLRPLVRHWFGRLVAKYDRDRGVPQEVMAALNEAHESLKEILDIN